MRVLLLAWAIMILAASIEVDLWYYYIGLIFAGMSILTLRDYLIKKEKI